MAERVSRAGRMNPAQSPVMTRSIGRRLGALTRTIEDQKLVLDEQRFGDDGTSTAGSERAGDRHNQMDEKKSPVAHNPDSLPSA